MTRYAILSILLLLLWASQGSGGDPQLILTELQERYDKLSDLAADFVQEVHSGVFAAIERTSGKMFLASGDKFRVQTDEQTIVSDGKMLWVYSRENKQVTIDKVAKSRDIVRPSDYLFSFRESYTSHLLPDTTIGKVECITVQLVCGEKDEFIQQMTLFVGKEDRLTHRASYIDINGNNVIIDFSNVKVDKGLPDDLFFFETPKGVEEVRLP